MIPDPKNQQTFTSMLNVASRATNNVAGPGLDLKSYQGDICIRYAVGVQTAGDNASNITVQMQSATSNSAAAATNISGASGVTDGNNALSQGGTIQVDPRACSRYLFARLIIAGANSPAWPVAVEACGVKQVQP